MRRHLRQPHIATIKTRSLLRSAKQKVHREPDLEGVGGVDFVDVFFGERDFEGVDVALEVRGLAAADDREDVGGFVEDVGEAGC